MRLALLAPLLLIACAPSTPTEPLGCRMTAGDSTSVRRSYRCVLRSGEPPLLVALLPDSSGAVVERIELRRDGEAAPFQSLTEGQEQPPTPGTEWFAAEDLDADGWLDLKLLTSWGATGNSSWQVWRLRPATRRFAYDAALRDVTSPRPVAGRPCLRGHANGGHAGLIHEDLELCLAGARWDTTWVETQDWHEPLGAYLRVRRERRGGVLTVTRTDTIPEGSAPQAR